MYELGHVGIGLSYVKPNLSLNGSTLPNADLPAFLREGAVHLGFPNLVRTCFQSAALRCTVDNPQVPSSHPYDSQFILDSQILWTFFGLLL